MNGLFRGMSLWREKFEKSTKEEKFMLMANTFLGAKYTWGSENPLKTDCSGLICGTFILLGFDLRINAEGLRRKVFTDPTSKMYDEKRVKAVFFVKDGKAEHVGIVGGPNVLYHSSEGKGAMYESLSDLVERYSKYGLEPEYRELSWEDLGKSVGEVYDLDEDLE